MARGSPRANIKEFPMGVLRSVFLAAILLGFGVVPARAMGNSQASLTPAQSPGPAPTASPTPAGERAALWQIHYDEGVRALHNEDREAAIKHLDKAVQALEPADDPDGLWRARIRTMVGEADLELAGAERNELTRSRLRDQALMAYTFARQAVKPQTPELTEAYCTATEGVADVRHLIAMERDSVASLLTHIGTVSVSQPTLVDLYLEVLRLREGELGEDHKDVMLYRRKVIRQVNDIIRRIRELRPGTSTEILFKADEVVQRLKDTVQALRERDRELSKKDTPISTNG